MTELEALVAVHGAIDRALQRAPERVESVAQLLPAYALEGTVGWYEEFERWSRAAAPEAEPVRPEDGLGQLAEQQPSPRMAARHLLAIAALDRARSDATDGDSEAVDAQLRAALSVEGIAAHDRSGELLARIRSELPSIGHWGDFVRRAVGDNLLAETLSAQADAPPCSGHVEPASSAGGVVDAATLFTTMSTQTVSFDRACRFLNPLNWPKCSKLWCDMTEITTKANGNPVLHEIVSLDCLNGLAWRAEAYLEFGYSWAPKVASVSYQLDPDRTAATDPITVDEGWLRVIDDGAGGVLVETLKTISFANSYFFTPGGIAAMMCPIGYGDAAGDLLFNCAASAAPTGTVFPGSQAADDPED